MNLLWSILGGVCVSLVVCGCSPDNESAISKSRTENAAGRVTTPRETAESLPNADDARQPNDLAPDPGLLPSPRTALLRAELLQAIENAASAFAATGANADSQNLSGRQFHLRLAFGCEGASETSGGARYSYDAKAGTLDLEAMPETWEDDPWVRDLVQSDTTEAIEGFWIKRPWLRDEGCPAPLPTREDVGEKAPGSAETVALVQRHDKDDSRLRRRNERAYRATKKVAPDAAPQSSGMRLLLEGRLISDAAPVRCHATAIDARPICLVLVEIDRVAFETSKGDVLAEWRT